MSARKSSVCGVVSYRVCPMVIQVESFVLITYSCNFLAYTLQLVSSHACVHPTSAPPQRSQILSALGSLCLCVYTARLKWLFVGKLIAMLKTLFRTAEHKLPIACIVCKVKTTTKPNRTEPNEAQPSQVVPENSAKRTLGVYKCCLFIVSKFKFSVVLTPLKNFVLTPANAFILLPSAISHNNTIRIRIQLSCYFFSSLLFSPSFVDVYLYVVFCCSLVLV